MMMADMKQNKPRPLTNLEVCGGKIPMWCEEYASWLSSLPSYQNMTNHSRMGRIRAMRSLHATLDKMLPGFSFEEKIQIATDINATAKLKSGAIN